MWLTKRAPRSAASKRRCVSFHNRSRLVSQPHNFSGFSLSLPEHPHRRYAPANVCIYCGSRNGLHDEHVIPLALGGRWILPAASCHTCGAKTSAFEGKYNRTVLGPLRMLYGIRTRRKKDRPKKLPLKIKWKPDDDWTTIDVPREQCPFLVLLPVFPMPDELSGFNTALGHMGATGSTFWIRGAAGPGGPDAHHAALAKELGVAAIQPIGTCDVPSICLTLAKVAHSFATAELGVGSFVPFLTSMIIAGDCSKRAQYIGGIMYNEPRSNNIHEVSFDSHTCNRPDIVSVRVRLLAALDTPTYFVAVGRRTTVLSVANKPSLAQ